MRVSLIIPAAGLGSRFQQSLKNSDKAEALRCLNKQASRSKLSYELDGEPVLLKTLRAFSKVPEIRETVIAITPAMRPELKKWAAEIKNPGVRWILGGKTRAGSVLNALKKTSPASDWIMVHDGARPLVTFDSIKQVLKAAKDWDGVILARKVVPTIKKVMAGNGHILETVDREPLYEAETPQLVRREVLLKAYKQNPKALEATDEAGLLEAVGARVRVVAHNGWNPKLTTATDLALAEAVLCRENTHLGLGTRDSGLEGYKARGEGRGASPALRFGIGFDTHRLVKGRKFYLGGIVIPSPKGALGHSDGDALLHAIADAILGAIGAGDIGEWFSDRDPKFKNIRSTKILRTVLDEAKRRGWKPYHVDTNIILETPKLYTHKPRIRANVAKCLGLPEKDVSIKARTREGLGPEGEGLAVTCEAVVSMKKVAL
ncbi:MAG TPA: 2-C-methyl-D-erythritol 2,4-cyclodiphosphate synthase [Candidatus Omnitrophota bacterium]|nr:2-C-methyl-D-erythritol 2,4-cyclodiphosphate synthase [Candidatus Omnitrophota bacterium]